MILGKGGGWLFGEAVGRVGGGVRSEGIIGVDEEKKKRIRPRSRGAGGEGMIFKDTRSLLVTNEIW